MQLTFIIIKPHIVKNPIILKKVHNIIKCNNFLIVKSNEILINYNLCKEFYNEHKSKFFYNRLLTFMTSGISEVHILARENAIIKWRELMGPTKVYKTIFTHPDTIRGQFGLSDTRNACHGSDSTESVANEIKLFFPDFNINEWHQKWLV